MSLLEKNIAGLTSVIQNSIFAQETVRKKGYLQSLDPRTKLICFIFMLFAVSFTQDLFSLLFLYLLLILLAFLSKISIRYFIARVWLFLPIFTGIIALPATLNIFTPGRMVIQLINLPSISFYLALTDNGIKVALFLISRVAVSVSLAILLIVTTDWINLMKAMERLHFPRVAILISLITYRYIFVLLNTANNMFLARKSRMVGKPVGDTRKLWLGSALGVLFGKTQVLSEGVYSAMKSRGFNNRVYIMSDFSFSVADFFAYVGTFLIILSIFIVF